MSYARRIVHYSPGPTDNASVISDRAVVGAWFELHRQGGCGWGELRLRDEFTNRDAIQAGDWIAFDFAAGDRWYLGRVEHRRANSPAGVTLRLQGMAAELGEVSPGGFGRTVADGIPPHRYGNTDLFPNDPDHFDETVDTLSEPHELMTLLMQQYVVPKTHITFDQALIESSAEVAQVLNLKFRGEETVHAVVKDMAVRARNASWGVDESGKFFFLRKRTSVIATYREGVDVLSLEESHQRESLFNRILLTGGFIYDETVNSDVTARGFYRWRGNYIQSASRSQHGERRIRLWVPWIRSPLDSREFAREFFRVYSQPITRYLVDLGNQTSLPKPWDGRIRIEARDGSELITTEFESIRVQFDHSPRFRLEIGPEHPHRLWPEPPQDDRSVIPGQADPQFGGELITLSSISSESFASSSDSGLSSESSASGSGSESALPDPFHWWKMDETSGSTAVDSADGKNLTAQGTYSWSTDKAPQPPGNSGSIDLDGSTGHLTTNLANISVSPCSMTVWVKVDAFQSTWPYISSVAGIEDPWLLRIGDAALANNKPQFLLRGVYRLDGTVGLSAGTWHHLAVTYDGSTMKLYVDGALDTSRSISIGGTINSFEVGTSNGGRYLDGHVDDLRIYKEVLTASEISALAGQ